MSRRGYRRLGLRAKLAVFTGLLIAATTTVMVTANSLSEQAWLRDQTVAHAAQLSSLLRKLTVSYEHDLRIDELKTALEDVIEQGAVEYAFVLDADNMVLVDGLEASRTFETVVDPLAERARAAGGPLVIWEERHLQTAEPVRFSDGSVGVVRLGLPLQAIRQDFAGRRQDNILVGAVITFGALAISLILAQRVTRPLQALTEATLRVAEGDLSRQVNCDSSDELGQLAASFNTMLVQLDSSARQISKLAYEDSLTSLPNRHQFRLDLERTIELARGDGAMAAVLCLDLDEFKDVNDTLGHPAGDLLLRLVAERLQACLAEGDGIARLGGDEFAILRGHAADLDRLHELCGRLVLAIAAPFDVDGHEVVVGVSIGAALFPIDAEDAPSLLRCADLALYQAKAEGRNGYRMFETIMRARLQARKALEQELRHALSRGEIELHYQAQADLRSGRITGAEALMRWRHPVRGMVPPSEFIPLAEQTGLIGELGAWALATGCAEAAAWPHGKVAINLSPVQFRQPGLVSQITGALQASGLAPERLELEITEGVVLSETHETSTALTEIRAVGVGIALDDFGTGYSSLSYLRRLPFGKIKIDRSFVIGLGRDPEARAIVRAIIDLGHHLGMRINAEGVETAEQRAVLLQLGCDEVQGYLLSKPCPPAEFRRLLEAPLPPVPAELTQRRPPAGDLATATDGRSTPLAA